MLVKKYQNLKQRYSLLIPELVRERIRLGNKNFSEIESEATIIFIEISNFNQVVESYDGMSLLGLLDTTYNKFDGFCQA